MAPPHASLAEPRSRKPRRAASKLAHELLTLTREVKPERISYTDEGTFASAKWRWHELMLADHLLPEETRCILSYILHRANWKDGGAYPGLQTIGDAVGFSVSKVKRWIRPAFTRGWLRRIRRGRGRTNIYLLSADAKLVDDIETVQRIFKERRDIRRAAPMHDGGSTVHPS
jgi:hypothetical protein